MNAYEREVILQSRRLRRWRMRFAAMLASAMVIAVALWSADISNQSWWRQWFASKPQAAPVVTNPTPAVTAPPGEIKPSAQLPDDGAVGRLRLLATQPGRNVREGTAQIATGAAAPLIYIAGALLANGAALIEVYADHVVLKRGALTTELYMDGVARNARAAQAIPARTELITVEAQPPPNTKAKQPVGPETYTNILRSAPRFEGNTIVGFEVYTGTDAGALSRLNLQSGDVLTELDGSAVTNVEQLHRSLKSINSGASVMATVLRGSEQIVVAMDGTLLKAQQQPVFVSTPVP